MASTDTVTYYELLGVTQQATADEVTRAYKKLRRDAHPDRGGTPALWRLYQEAYDTLCDPDARAQYDGRTSEPSPQPKSRYTPPAAAAVPPWSPQAPMPAARYYPPIGHTPELLTPNLRSLPTRKPLARVGMVLWWMVAVAAVCLLGLGTLMRALDPGPGQNLVLDLLSGGVFYLPFIVPQFLVTVARRRKAREVAGFNTAETARTEQANERLTADARRLDQRFGESRASIKEWGTPGNVSGGRFGAGADAGNAGERATAVQLATWFAQVPAARVFHGLRWPGTEHSDIDHAVLVGNRLAVIDSKNWRTGRYWWDGEKLFFEGKERDPFKVSTAAKALWQFLPGDVQVRTWVVMQNPAAIIDDKSDSTQTRAVTPARLIVDLERFLLEDREAHPGVVDRNIMRALTQFLI